MASYYYPSVVAFLTGMAENIVDPIEVADKFVLRKPYETEMNFVNQTIKDAFSQLPPIKSNYPLLEVNEGISGASTPEEHRQNVERDGENLILRAVTFLRLFRPGHLGFICYFVPLARTNDCGYSFRHTYLQTIPQWKNYPRSYNLPGDLSPMKSFVSQFWNEKVEVNNVVRLFNKSFIERHLEDKLNDLVFALEQLYLREESERSYLSYKLAIRCAFLLAEDPRSRRQIFKNVREGYKARSRIVHSGTRLEDDEETMSLIIKLEIYLTRSIMLYLENAEMFKSSELDGRILSA